MFFKQVDSHGSPLRIDNVLIGVFSRGLRNPGCGKPVEPYLYTRVTFFLNWINQNTASISLVQTNEVKSIAPTESRKSEEWWRNTGILRHQPAYAGYSPITHRYNTLPFYWRGFYQPFSPSNLGPYY